MRTRVIGGPADRYCCARPTAQKVLANPSCGLAPALVKGVDKNAEGEFEHVASRRHGVNLFGKASGELTKGRFDALAKM